AALVSQVRRPRGRLCGEQSWMVALQRLGRGPGLWRGDALVPSGSGPGRCVSAKQHWVDVRQGPGRAPRSERSAGMDTESGRRWLRRCEALACRPLELDVLHVPSRPAVLRDARVISRQDLSLTSADAGPRW